MNLHGIWVILSDKYPYTPVIACPTYDQAAKMAERIYPALTDGYAEMVTTRYIREVPFVEVVDGLKLHASDDNA